MSERTCIVTRQTREPEDMLRFVAAPDGSVVPDLKRNLPGRGCWVLAERDKVDLAVRRNLFTRAFKAKVDAPADLGAMVDGLMAKNALGVLGLARKAGSVAMGAAKVEARVRTGEALCVLHAFEASADGIRKITQARRAVAYQGGPDIPAWILFAEPELGLALGGTNVIHAAVLASEAGKAAMRRLTALGRYRGGSPVDHQATAVAGLTDEAAEDTE